MSDVVELLKPLIRHKTTNPGGDELALARYLAEALRQRGAEEVVVGETSRSDGTPGGWVYARWGTPTLVINAHLDTVPANAGWTGDPFVARVENDRVIGLGTCDTKGAIAATLAALDVTRPRNTAVLFSGDEERGTACLRNFLESPHAKGLTTAIVCEPTGCRPGLRHRGILALSFSLTGHGGHSSMADARPAPVAQLAKLASAIYDWGVERKTQGPEGFAGLCVNVAKLEGGVAFNVIPETARLSVSLRPPPGADQRALQEELTALATSLLPSVSTRVDLDHQPFQTRNVEVFRTLLGDDAADPIDMSFWTEAALLSEAGIDAVVWGPGDIALAHAPDEYVEIAQLERARDRFASIFSATRNSIATG